MCYPFPLFLIQNLFELKECKLLKEDDTNIHYLILKVLGVESLEEEDQGSQISQFLDGYRKGLTEQKSVSGPSLIGFINSLIGIRFVYIIVFLVAMLMLIQNVCKEEPLRVGERDHVD